MSTDDRRDRNLRTLLRGMQDIGRTLDRAGDRLARLERIIRGGHVTPPPGRRRSSAPGSIGAQRVNLQFFPNGGAEVVIDESKPVKLPPQLAALFAILLVDSGDSEDGLVGWKPVAEVRLRLYEKRGRDVPSDHALHQAIHRLRVALDPKGTSPGLVQFNPSRGYRLAVPPQGPSPVSPEAPAGGTGPGSPDMREVA